MALEGEEPVGFTAILFKGKRAVFKNHYVLPDHRRKGVFRKLFDFSIRFAALRGAKIVEAHCTRMSLPLYIDHGARIIEHYGNQITKVEFDLEGPWGKR